MSAAVLNKLDEIEAEMRRIGYWSDAPELQAAIDAGKFRNFLDAPSFPLWLQGLFLPNARAAVLEGSLPVRSQAGEIVRRQYAREAGAPEARRLLDLIREFDELCFKSSSDEPA